MSESAHVEHQFADARQQRDAVTLGMWVFLVSELMFFGGLFACYAFYRDRFPAGFNEAAHHLNVVLGALNTAILLTSSLTMAHAVYRAESGDRRRLVRFLVLTAVLGVVFLGIKGYEYYEKFRDHHVPGAHFEFDAAHAGPAQVFFSFYFVMTGVHAVHLLIGIVLMTILAITAARRPSLASMSNTIETAGLYWHFVDIVWIFLFPLLYLLGRHQ